MFWRLLISISLLAGWEVERVERVRRVRSVVFIFAGCWLWLWVLMWCIWLGDVEGELEGEERNREYALTIRQFAYGNCFSYCSLLQRTPLSVRQVPCSFSCDVFPFLFG